MGEKKLISSQKIVYLKPFLHLNAQIQTDFAMPAAATCIAVQLFSESRVHYIEQRFDMIFQ